MEIRRFKKADAPEVSQLIKECYLKLDIGGHTERGRKMQIWGNNEEDLIKRSVNINYFVAVENKKIIGICSYDKEQVHTWFVDINFHSCGIGKALLQKLLSEARAEGLKSITTWSTFYAEKFYLAFGFDRVKEIYLPEGYKDIILFEMIKHFN